MFKLNFFKKSAFGLDISDFSIEVLQLKKRVGKKQVSAFGRVNLEEGIISDGKILNKEKLIEKIKEVTSKTKAGKLQTRRVILAIPESKTFVNIFEFPVYLKFHELLKTVQVEVGRTIPIAFQDLYSDIQIISRSQEGFQKVRFVGVLKNIADDYKEVLEKAGLEPIAFDMESMSLAQVLIKESNKDSGTIILDIGARTTIVSIFDEGGLSFAINIPIAGNNFSQAISENLKIPLEEAEKLKRDYGLDEEMESGKIMLILQSIFQSIIDEIKNTIKYCEKETGKKINKIILCGGSSLIPKLPEYLSSNLGIETQIGDPWTDIDDSNLQAPEILEFARAMSPILYATVIGLAMRGLERDPIHGGINLLPVKK